MRKFTQLILIVFVFTFSTSILAQETVPFAGVDSQASSGVASVTATLTGGYILGDIDWDGFASTINSGTWGSELRCDISGPLGAQTVQLGTGNAYAPGANFASTTNLFFNAGDPAGVWTFDFYESYDDGGDGLPDAIWDNIDFTFNEYAVPTYIPITPEIFCQTYSSNFAAGDNVIFELNLLAANTYNFSLCINDLCCGGDASDFDGDFTMYDASFSQLWYYDGPSGCGFDATTFGSAYEDWSPTADGIYYLQVDDYYGNAGNFELAYIMGGAVQLGTPTATCTSVSGSWAAGEGVFHEFYLYPTETYNFSCCANDVCAGDCDGDADFTMYDNMGNQIFYIDGPSGCGFDATTIGSPYENFTPAYEGCYYLYVDDYYGSAANYTLAFVSAAAGTSWIGAVDTDWSNTGNWSSGLPAIGDDVTLAAGLPNYPVIDNIYGCNNLTIAAGASFTMATGGDFGIGGDLNCNGAFIMNDGFCFITGNLFTADPINSLVDINGGLLDIGAGWFENGPFTFARGSFQLSGGTINVASTVFWYDVNASSLMDGPFYMTVGGTMQTEAGNFADISGGTIEVTGTESGGGFLLSPSNASPFTAYNVVVSGGDYVTTRTTDANPLDILNDFTITGGTVTTENTGAKTTTFTVGGNCTVGVGANLTADVLTGFNVAGTMAIAADATGYGSLIDNGLVTAGTPIVQVAMAGPQWHTISTPCAGVESGWFTGLYLQNFDEPTNTWNDIVPTNIPIVPGAGYAFYSDFTQVGAFVGDFNSGAYNLTTTRNNLGWNMAGNPYPSAIDWDAAAGWTKTDVADALYVEDAGAWATWIAGVGTGNGSNLIAPAQGFFVECTNVAGGSLALSDGVRTHTRTAYLKSDVTDLLKLKVEGNGYSDDMAIRFLDDATAEFDYNYDAHKMFAYNVEIPQIYSMANGYMAINSLPATEMVATGFRTSIPGEFTISTIETSEFTNVVLEDLQTGVQTNLLADSYTFTANVDDSEGRFIVHFTPLSSPENNAQDMINIYSYHNNVYVSVPENTSGNIVVYNVTGQEVANTIINNTLNVIALDESAYYVVKVQSENSVTTEKVFVN